MSDRISNAQRLLALLTPRSMNTRELAKALGLRRKQIRSILNSPPVKHRLEKIRRIGHNGLYEVRYTTRDNELSAAGGGGEQ